MDASDALHTLLPLGVSVFSFDFAGSGLSDGEYVSLGYYEKEDVVAVVDYLRASGEVSTIGLWGRSMGAATALLYAHMDPSIAGMILDSPYSDLEVLCDEVIVASGLKLPKTILKMGLAVMKKAILKRAKFDVAQCAPLKFVNACFVPALFVHGRQDDFIVPRHSEILAEKYGSDDKNRVLVEGGHNSARPSFLQDSASIFFAQCLQVDVQANDNNADGGGAGVGVGFGGDNAGGGGGGGGGGGQFDDYNREDEDLAAAIAASLADMN